MGSAVDVLLGLLPLGMLLVVAGVSVMAIIDPWKLFRMMSKFALASFRIYRLPYTANPRFPEMELMLVDRPDEASESAQRAWHRTEPAMRALGVFLVAGALVMFVLVIVTWIAQ